MCLTLSVAQRCGRERHPSVRTERGPTRAITSVRIRWSWLFHYAAKGRSGFWFETVADCAAAVTVARGLCVNVWFTLRSAPAGSQAGAGSARVDTARSPERLRAERAAVTSNGPLLAAPTAQRCGASSF